MRIRRFHIRGRDLPSPLVGGYTIGNSGGGVARIEQLERALCRSWTTGGGRRAQTLARASKRLGDRQRAVSAPGDVVASAIAVSGVTRTVASRPAAWKIHADASVA